MRSPLATRIAASALAVAVVAGAAGCAADPGASNPVPTSTPTSAPTPEASPTAPAPTVEPAPSEQPTSPPASEFGAFSFEQLTDICVEATTSTFAPDVVFDTAGTRIEQRLVTPEWLVIVPATTSGYEGQSVCTIGGTPAAPELELSSGSIEQLPEEQIQNLIRGENEGGDR